MRKWIISVLAGFVLAGAAWTTTASAGPPNYLCTRHNVGQVISWSDGKWYRCTVKWTGNYGQYPVYYWLDIGYPAREEI